MRWDRKGGEIKVPVPLAINKAPSAITSSTGQSRWAKLHDQVRGQSRRVRRGRRSNNYGFQRQLMLQNFNIHWRCSCIRLPLLQRIAVHQRQTIFLRATSIRRPAAISSSSISRRQPEECYRSAGLPLSRASAHRTPGQRCPAWPSLNHPPWLPSPVSSEFRFSPLEQT